MAIPYAEVIGDPIAHSKSPLIHRFWLEKLGLKYEYRCTLVPSHDLRLFLASRRNDEDWCGCNVTSPHKEAVLRYVDEKSTLVQALGAANCILRRNSPEPCLTSSNTDWSGFLDPIKPWLKRDVTYKVAYIIGAGGAAAAVSYALNRAGFTIISINRSTRKALALRRRLELFDDDLVMPLESLSQNAPPGVRLPADWGDRTQRLDILVNTTPLGMKGYANLEVELGAFPADTLVYDVVYDPVETPLLGEARRRGMPTIDGLGMLIGQAAPAFELFFGSAPPRQHDAELRALLTS
jgi:shikimate dehydrogenase